MFFMMHEHYVSVESASSGRPYPTTTLETDLPLLSASEDQVAKCSTERKKNKKWVKWVTTPVGSLMAFVWIVFIILSANMVARSFFFNQDLFLLAPLHKP